MKRATITISDSGAVTVPNNVRMTISEIADLFGIYYQTAKRTIRTIKKLGIADGDYSMSCTCDGSKVCPDYYGLDMVVAIAFHVRSERSDVFRKWILKKVAQRDIMATLVLPLQNATLN